MHSDCSGSGTTVDGGKSLSVAILSAQMVAIASSTEPSLKASTMPPSPITRDASARGQIWNLAFWDGSTEARSFLELLHRAYQAEPPISLAPPPGLCP
ncbi:hypothetical protein [Azomonas macrocytogenes]|uniref:Uncharacterized protein n=1 Tax=Azomonas macrocytogenes TaxID=69962 RepID=A0A839T2C6_AZOMA|nr:hypothetical protein [Azomonas macrocytogenes]MBB3103258.1 hypothetical protein [Azomonas macrocytogenes]